MRLVSGLLAAAAILSLTACDGNPEETAVLCPTVRLLPDAATLTRYRGTGRDLSDLVLTARLTDVRGACIGTLGTREEGVRTHIVMVASRGPAATSSEADIPYGIGVLKNGTILDEARYVQHVVFPPNVTNVQVTGQEVKMKLPTAKKVGGSDYHLYVWLQLSAEQLAENRGRK